MSFIVKDPTAGADFDPVPMGMHPAVCYALIDIGTQPQFGNFKPKRQSVFIWELRHERIEVTVNGQKKSIPRSISEKYTSSLASMGHLRPMLEAWRGKQFTPAELDGFDMGKVVGANCLLNVIHKRGKGEKASRIYANVASVNPKIKGSPSLPAENPLIIFNMDDFSGMVTIPGDIPNWIKALIEQSEEYKRKNSPQAAHPQDGGTYDGGGSDMQDVPDEDPLPF